MQGSPVLTCGGQTVQASVSHSDRHLLAIPTSLSKCALAAKQHAVQHSTSHFHVTAAGTSMHWQCKLVPAHNLLTQPTYNRESSKLCKSVYPWEHVSEIQSMKDTREKDWCEQC